MFPSESSEPSENPTASEEPSDYPTVSEEPSENPTISEEPSESPSLGDSEPTEFPTRFGSTTDAPTTGIDEQSIFEIICDPSNRNVLGVLCQLVQLFPELSQALGRDPGESVIDREIIVGRVNRFFNLSGRKLEGDIGNHGLVSAALNREKEKRSNNFQRSIGEGLVLDNGLNSGYRGKAIRIDLLTMFAPTNVAFFTLPASTLENLMDPTNQIQLENLLKFHIIENEVKYEKLFCGTNQSMTNGKKTTTRCKNGFKYQVGPGNLKTREPEIVFANEFSINGVIHVIDEVILPKSLKPPDAPTKSPTKPPTIAPIAPTPAPVA